MAVSLKAKWQRREIASPTGKGLRYLQPLKSTLGADLEMIFREKPLSLSPSLSSLLMVNYSWFFIHGFCLGNVPNIPK
jgi:hypothetical protein